MMDHGLKAGIFIVVTLFISMILAILPMPQSIVWMRPEWVFMVLFFWVMMMPHRVGVIVSFLIGLFMDLLTGTLLGLHALLFSTTAFLLLHFFVQIHGLPIWQRALVFFGILIGYFSLQAWIFSMTNVHMSLWQIVLPAATSALLWPWVYLLLRDYQQRYEIG